MPPRPTEYGRRPYAKPAYASDLRLGDLLRSSGRNLAEHELRRGDASAAMWANLGQTIAGTIGGYLKDRQEAPFRQMALENTQLQNTALKTEAAGQQKERAILPMALVEGENGISTYDRNVLTKEFTAAGIADRLPNIFKGLDTADAAAFTLKQAKQEALAGLAYGVLSAGASPESFNLAIQHAVKNGIVSRQEVSQIIQSVGDDPRKIQQVALSLAGADPKFAQLLEVARGNKAQEATVAATAAATAADRTADNTRLDATATETARHHRAMEARPTGGQSDDKPSVWVSKDGDMRFVTPQEAGQLSQQGWKSGTSREQGRPVTSGDAGRIADLDTSLKDLEVLTKTVGAVAGSTGTRAQIGAALPNWVTEWTGRGATAKSKQAVIDRVKQVIGKALEGGVLRKEDEIKYAKILPTIGDVESVVKAKLEGLTAAITQRRQTTLEALADAGYDTSRFSARTIDAPAIERPKADPLGLFD